MDSVNDWQVIEVVQNEVKETKKEFDQSKDLKEESESQGFTKLATKQGYYSL